MLTGPAIPTAHPVKCPECGDNDASKHFSSRQGLRMIPTAVSQMSDFMRNHEGCLQYGAAVMRRKPGGDFARTIKGVMRTERRRSQEK